MLPVILLGENTERLQTLSQSLKHATCVPLHSLSPGNHSSTLPSMGMPSIILLDVDKTHNANLAGYIRRLRMSYYDSAILVMIPFGDDEGEKQAMEAQTDDILTRPVSTQRLELTIKNLSEMVSMRVLRSNHSDRHDGREMQLRDNRVGYRSPESYTLSLMDQDGQLRRLLHMEQDIIEHAVAYYNGHISQAARALGIGRSTLYRKLDAIKTRNKYNPSTNMVQKMRVGM